MTPTCMYGRDIARDIMTKELWYRETVDASGYFSTIDDLKKFIAFAVDDELP